MKAGGMGVRQTPGATRSHYGVENHDIQNVNSGYTAKIAGTERSVNEPRAVFSACFGAPFMALPPAVYAKLLGEKIAKHQCNIWLVTTGRSGGPYGIEQRINIGYTRAMVRAARRTTLAAV